MTPTTLLEQMPRFSAYDPGATGEGSLDPLGLGAVADRVADRLVPGVRTRMSEPRFVTLTAVGALACQPLVNVVSTDGRSTADLAFEWLVVESLVRSADPDRSSGLPGSQKARRAVRAKERLGAGSYLAGPRVFGFTGVYRPFSLDAGILDPHGQPAANAEALARAWEVDQGLTGFVDTTPGSPGLRLRHEIERECLRALEAGHVTAPPTGWLMRAIADGTAPQDAGAGERSMLRTLIAEGPHHVRNELVSLLTAGTPDASASERDIARALLARATPGTAVVLRAVIDFETCATAIEYAFRRLLAYGTSLGGSFSDDQAVATPKLADLVPNLGRLTAGAVDSVAALDETLAQAVDDCFRDFRSVTSPSELVGALLARHEQVQSIKDRRTWVDRVKDRWVVRPPYRNQRLDLTDDVWTHPTRLRALLDFVSKTS